MSTLVTENGESSRYASASLLHTLQFHGEQFMQSFASGMPSDLQKMARNRQAFYKAEIPFVNSSFENTGESETEEWSGMSSSMAFLYVSVLVLMCEHYRLSLIIRHMQ